MKGKKEGGKEGEGKEGGGGPKEGKRKHPLRLGHDKLCVCTLS